MEISPGARQINCDLFQHEKRGYQAETPQPHEAK